MTNSGSRPIATIIDFLEDLVFPAALIVLTDFVTLQIMISAVHVAVTAAV